jgi:tyrosyl-tRNA synthetase
MSKTFGNAIGVTDPPEEMFGRLMSVPDDVMPDYYVLLLEEDLDPSRHAGEAKRELARRLVERFHGPEAAAAAEERFDLIHKEHGVPEDIPTAHVRAGENGEVHLPALIAEQFDLSTSEARRLIGQGGVRLDGVELTSDRLDLPSAELSGKVLQVGKRRFVRLSA